MGGDSVSQSAHKPQLRGQQSHSVLLSILCQRKSASCDCCVVAVLMFDGPITENGQETRELFIQYVSGVNLDIKQPHTMVHKLRGLTLPADICVRYVHQEIVEYKNKFNAIIHVLSCAKETGEFEAICLKGIR